MLKFFRRNRPAPLPAGADPLRIRDLLDDPRLQAVMGSEHAPAGSVAPFRRVERERRATTQLFERAA